MLSIRVLSGRTVQPGSITSNRVHCANEENFPMSRSNLHSVIASWDQLEISIAALHGTCDQPSRTSFIIRSIPCTDTYYPCYSWFQSTKVGMPLLCVPASPNDKTLMVPLNKAVLLIGTIVQIAVMLFSSQSRATILEMRRKPPRELSSSVSSGCQPRELGNPRSALLFLFLFSIYASRISKTKADASSSLVLFLAFDQRDNGKTNGLPELARHASTSSVT